jgi:hypothetical protein
MHLCKRLERGKLGNNRYDLSLSDSVKNINYSTIATVEHSTLYYNYWEAIRAPDRLCIMRNKLLG